MSKIVGKGVGSKKSKIARVHGVWNELRAVIVKKILLIRYRDLIQRPRE